MKFGKKTYGGGRPVYTSSPLRVTGGFNLDTTAQGFNVGDIVPAGTLAVYDESTRKVKVLKTGKVKAINGDDAKIVTLESSMHLRPIFKVGDKVLVTVAGKYADAPTINAIAIGADNGDYVITLSAELAGLAEGDVLVQVISQAVISTPVIAGVKVVDEVDATKIEISEAVDIVAGDLVMAYPLAGGALYANAVEVTSYDPITGEMVLATNVDVAVEGAQIVKVHEGAAGAAVITQTIANAALIGLANAAVIVSVEVNDGANETGIDITVDSGSGAWYARRILPIPATLMPGNVLLANPNIKFTQSF